MQNLIVNILGKPTDITDTPVVVVHDMKRIVFCRNLKEAEHFCYMMVKIAKDGMNPINDLYWYPSYREASEKLKGRITEYILDYSRLNYCFFPRL